MVGIVTNPVHSCIVFKGTETEFRNALELLQQQSGKDRSISDVSFAVRPDGQVEVRFDTPENIELCLAKKLSALLPEQTVHFDYAEDYPIRAGSFLFAAGQVMECEYRVGRTMRRWSSTTGELKTYGGHWKEPALGNLSATSEQAWATRSRHRVFVGLDEDAYQPGKMLGEFTRFECDRKDDCGDRWSALHEAADVHSKRYPDGVVPNGGFLTTLVNTRAPELCRPEAVVDCPVTLVPRSDGVSWNYCVVLADRSWVIGDESYLLGELHPSLAPVVREWWPATHTGVVVRQEFDEHLGWRVQVYFHPQCGEHPEVAFPAGFREALEAVADPTHCLPTWMSTEWYAEVGSPDQSVSKPAIPLSERNNAPSDLRSAATAITRSGCEVEWFAKGSAEQAHFGDEPLVHLLGTVNDQHLALFLSLTGVWTFADAYDVIFALGHTHYRWPPGIEWVAILPPSHVLVAGAGYDAGALWVEREGGSDGPAYFRDTWLSDLTEENLRPTATATADEFYQQGLAALIPSLD